jgi:hypothetical protein
MIALLLATLSLRPALAGGGASVSNGVLEAERIRLSDEMRKMADRQAWQGVEHCIDQMEERGMTLSFADLVRAAHAARELGDLSLAYARLQTASQMKEDRGVIEALYDLDSRYGRVALTGAVKGSLDAGEFPFDPDARRAVQSAMDAVSTTGNFTGLLPAGRYVYAGQSFDVAAGSTVTLALQPQSRRQRASKGS